ncbi:MAG TPA: gamma-glutamyltransferase, partial [Candidatus Dormibacteraeota bacterium]|nr:gamma-glutamyltransferase [Candidatus Dormibacteraeota bacterium]
MSRRYSRREMLARTAAGLAVGFVGGSKCFGTDLSRSGAIVGETAGAEVGKNVLASAGNAVDAAVGAALTSAVATPARCGIAGYGGHMIIALKSGKVTCIDFNTMGPAAARPDMYPLDEKGEVKGGTNLHGWLAIGVPGTLAGLQLALDRYGTKPFRELVQPAIEVAKNGFVLS